MVDERGVPPTARGAIARRPVLARRPRPVPPSVWMLPDPHTADEDGVVGVGADLAPSTLVDAYRRGMFPWPHPGVPLPWFSPDPRGVLPLDRFHVSRSLQRTLRTCGWTTSVDQAFETVIAGCADRPAADGTWITDQMRDAYTRLHQLGWAHSLEVWADGALVGGVYGVQIGGVFTGESMFHRATDASKVALADLVARLREAGGRLLDVQLTTSHLCRLGAIDVPRERFLRALDAAAALDVRLAIDERPVSRLAGSDGKP
jgi:leucyl/phenylalanyl-tRNA---protein transferase